MMKRCYRFDPKRLSRDYKVPRQEEKIIIVVPFLRGSTHEVGRGLSKQYCRL